MSRESLIGTIRTVRRLEKSIPQVRWYRMELVLMSLFINIFALGLPVFILQVYDRVLPSLGLTTMQFLVIGLIAVMLLDFLLKTIRASITTYTGARFEHLARVSAVDHILRTPQDVYEKETPGVYLDKVNAIGVVKDFYSSQLGTLMIDLPFAFFFLGMIWLLGGIMVAVPIVLLTLFFLMAVIVGGNLRRAVDTRSQVDNKKYDFLIEIMNGIHTVKAQAFKNLLQRRFETIQELSARTVRSVAMQSSIAQGLGSTFGQLNMACVIGVGAILVIDGSLSAGELAACTLLSGRAMQPLQSAMGLWTSFQTIRVACNNAIEVLELPAESDQGLPEFNRITGAVEFRNISFGEKGTGGAFINNLSLRIEAGTIVGIDGDNSSGNSTLLKLLVGLIRPNQGQVLVDGKDISGFQSVSYREQMAFLAADADVYTGTILDNMTYFRGGKFIRKAMKLSKELGLDEEIKRLPEGYSTQVGDGAGGILPAGFVQRITIIRAMVDDPKIVLFDRANEGLDSASDAILLEFLKSLRGKTTVVLVSARPSWLRVSDRQYVMSYGEISEKTDSTPRSAMASPSTPSQTLEVSAQQLDASAQSNQRAGNDAQEVRSPIDQAVLAPAPKTPSVEPAAAKQQNRPQRTPAPPPGRPASMPAAASTLDHVMTSDNPTKTATKSPPDPARQTPRTAAKSETSEKAKKAPSQPAEKVAARRKRTPVTLPSRPIAKPVPKAASPNPAERSEAFKSAVTAREATVESAARQATEKNEQTGLNHQRQQPTARPKPSAQPVQPTVTSEATNDRLVSDSTPKSAITNQKTAVPMQAATPRPTAKKPARSVQQSKPNSKRTSEPNIPVPAQPTRQRAAPPPKPPRPMDVAKTNNVARSVPTNPEPAPLPTAANAPQGQSPKSGHTSQQPRAAATLRPAAAPQQKNKAVLRPQPPQAKRPPVTEGVQ